MIIDDFICSNCNKEYNNIDKDEGIPKCDCGGVLEKNWAHCNCRIANRGQPTNARLCNDGSTVNRFCAKDDPLTRIEIGLQRDNHSGIRSFSPEQAREFRERANREDSPRLRQEILDTRERNLSEQKAKKQKRLTSIGG